MPATENFPNQNPSIDGPITGGFAVTASDAVDMPRVSRALWVGTGGTLVVVAKGGESLTFKNVPSGTLLPIRATRVMATGTTAADIVGMD